MTSSRRRQRLDTYRASQYANGKATASVRTVASATIQSVARNVLT